MPRNTTAPTTARQDLHNEIDSALWSVLHMAKERAARCVTVTDEDAFREAFAGVKLSGGKGIDAMLAPYTITRKRQRKGKSPN